MLTFSFFPPHKVLALISGHFKPLQIFLLPVFTVSIPAVYMIPLEIIIGYKHKLFILIIVQLHAFY